MAPRQGGRLWSTRQPAQPPPSGVLVATQSSSQSSCRKMPRIFARSSSAPSPGGAARRAKASPAAMASSVRASNASRRSTSMGERLCLACSPRSICSIMITVGPLCRTYTALAISPTTGKDRRSERATPEASAGAERAAEAQAKAEAASEGSSHSVGSSSSRRTPCTSSNAASRASGSGTRARAGGGASAATAAAPTKARKDSRRATGILRQPTRENLLTLEREASACDAWPRPAQQKPTREHVLMTRRPALPFQCGSKRTAAPVATATSRSVASCLTHIVWVTHAATVTTIAAKPRQSLRLPGWPNETEAPQRDIRRNLPGRGNAISHSGWRGCVPRSSRGSGSKFRSCSGKTPEATAGGPAALL
mmetsp:Transcript_158870/g.509411  ORF Transcript_158870/g.509411 Transcript_158870/m.509411 type:complete len:366 (+) Transcript_158870:72-1169(+)